MTRSVDPPRLLELADTPPNLHKLLQSARGDGPSAAEIEQLIHVAGSLGESFQSGLFLANQLLPQAAAPSGALGLFAGTGKFFATVVLAISTSALGVAGWSFLHGDETRESTSQPRVSSPRLTVGDRSAHDQGSDARPVGVESQAQVADSITSSELHGQDPSQSLVDSGSTPRPKETWAPASRRAAARRGAASSATPMAAMPDPEEFRVLQAAREKLPSSPASALVLAESHARRFSRGMLDQERETIAIEALARLGRADEARARSKVFLSRFPASPYRSRVEAAIPVQGSSDPKP
ncbi:MAG TPA: hypothetical protein VKP30_22620 [Polyangiaceae bacterium]|nr:hypothetical protein [Polyangiaceae bacterium]